MCAGAAESQFRCVPRRCGPQFWGVETRVCPGPLRSSCLRVLARALLRGVSSRGAIATQQPLFNAEGKSECRELQLAFIASAFALCVEEELPRSNDRTSTRSRPPLSTRVFPLRVVFDRPFSHY
jgi:hypothetical protein